MKSKIGFLFLSFLLLAFDMNARQFQNRAPVPLIADGDRPTEWDEGHLVGKFASVEVYLYSENELSLSQGDTITWTSGPDYTVFVKEGEDVRSYLLSSDASFAFFRLLLLAERHGYEENEAGLIGIVSKLADRHWDLDEVVREPVGGDVWHYRIPFWLHYFREKDYLYRMPAGQNASYAPEVVLGLSSERNADAWADRVHGWQRATYGKCETFRLYRLTGESDDGCLLLKSVFGGQVRYDLIVQRGGRCDFYLSQDSFFALARDFCLSFEGDVFLQAMKALCLIDCFYAGSSA